MANELINADKLRAEMDRIIEMLTHPEFVAAIKEMKDTPVSKRREFAKKRLTVASLKRKGVPLSTEMRLTTRYFEPGRPEVLEITPDGEVTGTKFPKLPIGIPRPHGPLGDNNLLGGICACGGIGPVCAGAGVSTVY
jgi:hypothetical protein